jgi:PAS domain S-box-containing protein
MSQSPTSRNEQGALLAAPTPITTAGLLQFLDIAPDALLVIDRAGTITVVNEQTEALFGYARSELPGQPLAILLPDRFRAAHLQHYCSA